MESQSYSSIYVGDLLHYLDTYVRVIDCPQDVIGIFSRVKRGKRHVWLGLRVLFNYLEALGYDQQIVNILRKSLPKANHCGLDLKVPTEEDMIRSMRQINLATLKYRTLYNLLVDSGLRLVEGLKVLNEFDADKVEKINGFYRVEIGAFRGNKQAFFGYFSEYTFKLLYELQKVSMRAGTASHRLRKHKVIAAKYIRKFAFDMMLSLEIPESVCDFLEGHIARRIGAKHYCALRRQADKFYSKYNDYLTKLRQQVHAQ